MRSFSFASLAGSYIGDYTSGRASFVRTSEALTKSQEVDQTPNHAQPDIPYIPYILRPTWDPNRPTNQRPILFVHPSRGVCSGAVAHAVRLAGFGVGVSCFALPMYNAEWLGARPRASGEAASPLVLIDISDDMQVYKGFIDTLKNEHCGILWVDTENSRPR